MLAASSATAYQVYKTIPIKKEKKDDKHVFISI